MTLTTENFIKKARFIHGNRYDYSLVNYKNSKTKIDIICLKHGVFSQTPDKHINAKSGCPYCAGNKSNCEKFICKAKKIHGNKYDYSLVEYKNNKTKVVIVCAEHGEFEQTPSNHLSGYGCKYCANNVRSTIKDFVSKAISIHGDRYDYSLVEYVNNRTNVKIKCLKHGVFEQVPYIHLSGSGCPKCSVEHMVSNRDYKKLYEHNSQIFMKRYGVINPMFNADIRKKHADVVSSEEVNKKRIRTKRMNNSFNTSLSEYRLKNLLIDIFGESDVVSGYSCEAYPYQCDFYIKSRDLYIELNAHWTHDQHWYDVNCKDDVDKIHLWSNKSDFYRNASTTWSIRDVKKRECARLNKLNYVVFWDADLSDAKKWIEMGCPDGQDWLREYSWL